MIDQIFLLPYSICTSDFAREEIQTVDVNALEMKGLTFQTLEAELVSELTQVLAGERSLAAADVASFILAREKEAILISGDKRLVRFSKERNVAVHGLLWLMDEMLANKILTGKEATEKLHKVLDQNARLPLDECQKRFDVWRD